MNRRLLVSLAVVTAAGSALSTPSHAALAKNAAHVAGSNLAMLVPDATVHVPGQATCTHRT